jgi:hypothetical protein
MACAGGVEYGDMTNNAEANAPSKVIRSDGFIFSPSIDVVVVTLMADAMHSMMRLDDAGADIHVHVEARLTKEGAAVGIGIA